MITDSVQDGESQSTTPHRSFGLYTSMDAAEVVLAFEVPSSLVSANLPACSQLKP